MATTTLYPDGDGSILAVIGWTSPDPPYYIHIDEGTVSPDDADSVVITDTPGYFIATLSNLPSDAGVITGVTIKIRTSNDSKGRTVASCQLFQSNESTALTALANISGSTTPTTYSLSPSITGSTTKAAWDGARLKINSGGSGGWAYIYAVQIDITYTISDGSSNTQTGFLIGF